MRVQWWRIVLAVIVFFLVVEPVMAMEVAGVKLEETVTVGEGPCSELVLNGAGVRRKLFTKVYVGALYLEEKQQDVQAILESGGPKRVVMHILYDTVKAGQLTAGWNEGFNKNISKEERIRLQDRLIRFNSLFRNVVKGDVLYMDYLPDKGTLVRINDELLGTVPGADFNRMLLKVWLGEKPVDKGLKEAMLGN